MKIAFVYLKLIILDIQNLKYSGNTDVNYICKKQDIRNYANS